MKSASAKLANIDFFEPASFSFEDLYIGKSASIHRTILGKDIQDFSDVSGDTNPIHIDEEFAKNTPFGGCIAHGMFSASLISAVIGTKLFGPGCIYMSQTLRFLAPVRVGETVYVMCKIKETFPEKSRVLLDTKCYVKDTVVIDGEALIKITK